MNLSADDIPSFRAVQTKENDIVQDTWQGLGRAIHGSDLQIYT